MPLCAASRGGDAAQFGISRPFARRVHDEGLGSDPMAEMISVSEAYVGEVMVDDAGGTWADPPTIGGHFGVVLPSGNFANPISKAFTRVDAGPTGAIPHFSRV